MDWSNGRRPVGHLCTSSAGTICWRRPWNKWPERAEELVRRLREAIGAWTVLAIHASLFGSTARGDGGLTSDVDLFLVRPGGVDAEDGIWREQIDDLAESVCRWTGNRAGIAEVSESELPQMRRDRPPIVGEVAADAIDLAGQPARHVLSGA